MQAASGRHLAGGGAARGTHRPPGRHGQQALGAPDATESAGMGAAAGARSEREGGKARSCGSRSRRGRTHGRKSGARRATRRRSRAWYWRGCGVPITASWQHRRGRRGSCTKLRASWHVQRCAWPRPRYWVGLREHCNGVSAAGRCAHGSARDALRAAIDWAARAAARSAQEGAGAWRRLPALARSARQRRRLYQETVRRLCGVSAIEA